LSKGETGHHEAVSEPVKAETYRTSDTRDHLVELDAIRGIAIIGVVMNHLTSHWKNYMGPVPVPGLGIDALEVLRFPGVPLFFLLSGYLLTWTEGKRAERGTYSLRSYALRRVLRLVPAYYVAIVVVLLVWPRTPSLWDVLSHMAFVHGLTPQYARTMSPAMWSLTPEVIFYCLLPFVILKLPRLWQRLALFVVLYLASLPTQMYVAVNVMDREKVVYGQPDWFQFYAGFPTTLLYLFIAGMLLRMMVEHLNARPMPRWQPYVASALFVVSTLLLLGLSPVRLLVRLLDLERTAAVLMSVAVSDASLIAFFASGLLGAPILRRLLRFRLLSFIGLISYSMFLFHQTILLFISNYVLHNAAVNAWVTQNNPTMWLSFSAFVILFFALTSGVSYLSYRFIESPFLRIKPK
jgi:peptidoglycan/LPS O-acetylase OafA/YrhL